ncbi:MAG: hypothetical protein ABSF46_10610 [Terriglobia bacterium]
MENPIRVLVANRPRLMRDLIRATLGDQPDIEIVNDVPDEPDIPKRVEETNPDFVIISQDKLWERPNVCDITLRQRPDVRIIAVAQHRNYFVYFWASPDIHFRHLEASEEALLGILRTKPIRGAA